MSRDFIRMLSASIIAGGLFAAAPTGCTTVPEDSSDRKELLSESEAALSSFTGADPSLEKVLDEAAGYAIFPDVGKGGFIVGGAYGRGVVYEGGKMVGHADLRQASVGAQIGGQAFNELIVFKTPEALQRFKQNELAFGASASAVAIKSGAATAADYKDGVGVFIMSTAGFMASAAVEGQQFTYVPLATDHATTRMSH